MNNQTIDVKQEDSGGAVVSSTGPQLMTLDDVLKAAQIDLDRYAVERHVVNKWDSVTKDGVRPMWQIKVWLHPRVAPPVQDLYDALIKRGPVVKRRVPRRERSGEVVLEIGMYDVHMGLVAFMESSGEKYDLNTAADMFYESVRYFVEAAKKTYPSIERVLFPVGNDFFHVDNDRLVTHNNTFVGNETNIPYRELFAKGKEVVIGTIETLSKEFPDTTVEVIVVPGNHDYLATFHLGEVLDAWFRNSDNVVVDNSTDAFKYRRFGKTLLGFTHGKTQGRVIPLQELPLIMATDVPEDWAEATHREFHIGHQHKMQATEVAGVRVRMLPSLTANGAWARESGYRSMRAAEAYIWSRSLGYVGHFSISPTWFS